MQTIAIFVAVAFAGLAMLHIYWALGGKSESKRLFGTNHSMISELPEEMKNLACLKVGLNEIQVDYQRLQDVDSTGMTIELRSEEQFGTDECRFHFHEEPGESYESRSMTESFDM